MNASSTLLTAFLRGFYLALIAGATAGLTTLQQTNDTQASIITGALAALVMLGARGFGEGSLDARRQENGDIKPGDVQSIGEGKSI